MDVKQLDKTIGFGLAIIAGYYVVGVVLPVLVWGEIGLVVFRIYLTQRNQRK